MRPYTRNLGQLSLRVTVLETRPSRSKPDRGVVHSFIEVMNQNREVVMSLKMVNFVHKVFLDNEMHVV